MSLSGFTFYWPWLLLLFPLPFFFSKRAGALQPERNAARVPFYDVIDAMPGNHRDAAAGAKQQDLLKWLTFAAWVCLVFSVARPAWVGEPTQIPTSGRDLMLAVDLSGSMREKDMVIRGFQVTRLDAVKQVVSDFIAQRKGDRLGLILFGTHPYVQAPLTFDRATVNSLLQEAMLNMAGERTAIGDAIGMAVKRLRNRPADARVLVLLTDGANTAGEVPPIKAAELAAQEQVRIYTIGIGAEEMVKRGFFANQVVNPSADLDEDTLTKIANLTGGQYFRARSAPELELVYEAVNTLEPVEQETKTYRPEKELYYWPLSLAVLLVMLRISTRIRFKQVSRG